MSATPPPEQAPAPPPPASKPGPGGPRNARGRRLGRLTLRLISGLWILALVTLAAGMGTAWWWSGTPQSLGTVLSFATRWLPEGQALATRDVNASLRSGGRIGWLRWESPTLAVEVQDLQIGWQLRPLLERRLEVTSLQAARIVLTPRTPEPPPPEEPLQPLQQLRLPLDIVLDFDLRHLRWAAQTPIDVHDLRGSYRYADARHALTLANVDVADGRYQGRLQLQADAPMAVEAQVSGRVQAPLPEGRVPLVVLAEATIHGTLATEASRLQAQARLAPEGPAGRDAMRAEATAEIAPWAAMPLVQAQADFEAIDAARLWPGAPRTLLTGRLDAGPLPAAPGAGADTTTRWQARIDARNADSGPWDSGKLPLTRLQATARQQGTQWEFPEVELLVGAGRLRASGNWAPEPAPWRVLATLEQLQPALLHSALDASPVSGTAQAEQRAGVIRFDTALQAQAAKAGAKPPGGALQGFRLDQLQARGQWTLRSQVLQLQALQLVVGPASLTGQATVQVATRAGEGQLQLQAPGTSLQLAGRMAPRAGDLQTTLAIRDASALQQWARSLPGMAAVLSGASADGALQLDARLEGGWQTLQAQVANLSSPQDGLRLQATMRTPRLDLLLPDTTSATDTAEAPGTTVPTVTATGTPAPPPAAGPRRIRLSSLYAEVNGTPAQARISADGSVLDGARSVALSTRATAGLANGGQWQIALETLRASLADTTRAEAAPWQLQLGAPLQLHVLLPPGTPAAGTPALRVDASASRATLGGPVPGTVQIDWQATQFTRLAPATAGQPAAMRLRSQGRLTGLPMAWAAALGVDTDALDDAGIRGDLVFDASWDIDAAERLRAHAEVSRRSGDIQVLAGGATLVRRVQTWGTGTASETMYDEGRSLNTTPTPAGVRTARLVLDAQDQDVRAQLAWESERAGSVQADLRTRVQQADGAWAWPEDAPLAGTLRASLPAIGAWSFLAPPAWRIDGSLQADATLAGNRRTPQWNGTLAADGLALRIPVEGVDLRDGRLRARLDGNRLRIEEFLLRGGPASRARIAGPSGNLSTVSSEAARDGGTLTVRGDMAWTPGSPTESGIRMDLTAELRALRLLVRSDRQISSSGNLQASMAEGQLRLRGQLGIDRGVVILPESSAPTLGSDVVIRSAARDAEAAEAAARRAKQEQRRAESPQTRKPPDIAVRVAMGNDFAIQGMGITTRLAGEIEVSANAASRMEPRITGEIRPVAGRYRAYGQELDVESGIVRFNGPYDNPSLDILAVRPNITQRAGVRIVGTANAPRVQIYSQPVLPDAEALAWVVLGRSAAGSGADAAIMQQAALALLSGLGPQGGGGFASRFGLDEIGFRGPNEGDDVRGAAISVGKRISDNLYVTYEHSLAGALGTFYVFYDLTQRLALRGQAGTRSAVDLIYTLSYD